jgi:cell division septation protein DedD
MKAQTYFLNGKALTIVVGGLAGSGALIFLIGVIVGLSIDPPAIRAGLPGIPALPGAAAIASAMLSSTNSEASVTLPSNASSGPEAAAAWPFSVPGSPAAPAEADSAAAAPAAPAPPAPAPAKGDTTAKRRAAVTDAAYVTSDAAPRAVVEDTRHYTVQVGAFRVERNAQALMDRLLSAGYRPVASVRMEGERALHVVSVGGYIGRRAAIMAAVKIGDAENLVASPVPARGR